MATRRMFSSRITESTRFLKMPATSQNLYFHLCMNADDDGVVEAYPVMCTTSAAEDDLRILAGKGFVTVLNDDEVSFINDWREHNKLRGDRKVDSIYQDLLLKVVPDAELLEGKSTYYVRSREICQTNGGQMVDKCPANDGLGKDRLGKDSIGKVINKDISSESNKFAPPESGILLPLVDKSSYDVPLDKIQMWEEAYPGVDVKQELYKMRAWLASNPKKQKTARGINRFMNSWLEREQNSGRAKGVKEDAGAGRKPIMSANEIARRLAAGEDLD